MQTKPSQASETRKNVREARLKVKLVELIPPNDLINVPIIHTQARRDDCIIAPFETIDQSFRHNDVFVVFEDLTMGTVASHAVVVATTYAILQYGNEVGLEGIRLPTTYTICLAVEG